MDIDLSVLRLMEREREIPFEELVQIIEQAILTAYLKHIDRPKTRRQPERRTRPQDRARRIFVPELDDEGASSARSRRTPPTSAVSPPSPPSRSSTSVCEISQMITCSASSRAERATSSPASSSRAPTRG